MECLETANSHEAGKAIKTNRRSGYSRYPGVLQSYRSTADFKLAFKYPLQALGISGEMYGRQESVGHYFTSNDLSP